MILFILTKIIIINNNNRDWVNISNIKVKDKNKDKGIVL